VKPSILIIGGGKTGAHLAQLLMDDGHPVKVIEARRDVLAKLHRELPTESVVEGDGTDVEILRSAGIRAVQVVAAMTGRDEVNLAVAALARLEFRVPRVVARINNPKNAWLFTPEMGVDVALNQSVLLAQMIAEKITLGDVMNLNSGQFSVVEAKVSVNSPAADKAVAELRLPPDCLLMVVVRSDGMLVPRGDTVLRAADEVFAVVSVEQKDALLAYLGGSRLQVGPPAGET
jgi:trk system potassium uptake protein TrkA